jgi:threonine dehydratase
VTTRADIQQAYKRIRPYIRRTPVIELEAGTFGLEFPLNLKLESLQHTASFKPRGAFNRVLSNPVPPSGIIAASGGNHGAATAYVGHRLGYPAEIFVPEISSPAKIERIRDFGAQVTITGKTYAEALEASNRRAAGPLGGSGALVVHAYDQPETLAGQGTVGLEWEEQAPDLDTVLIAVGGGGLIGGIAAWYGGRVRVVGVEPQGCPSLARALEAGRPVDVPVSGIATDSLGARSVGSLMFEIARRYQVPSVLVSDESIRAAQKALWRELRIVAEPGGATAMAALISGAYRPQPGERVGVLICGANTDPSTVV